MTRARSSVTPPLCSALALALALSTQSAHARMVMPPYLQAVTTTGVCVMVECDATNAVTVEYGLSASYGNIATTAFYLPTTGTTYVHRVPLTGLQPNTTWHYRASHGDAPSADAAFGTAVQPGTAFRFSFMSDFQSTATTQDAMVSQLLKTHHPRVSVCGGDMASSGPMYARWKSDFLNKQQALIAGVPFFGAVGNHDGWGRNPVAFLQAPASASGTQAYYSFDYGDVHFLILNNNVSYGEHSAQYAFAQADLAANSSRWKIVVFHMSAYCAGGHGENRDMKAMTRNIFEPHSVNMCLTGHSHFYQHNFVNGIHHMVLGPAHKNPRSPESAAYTIKSVKASSYGVIDVSPVSLTLAVYDADGSLLDTVAMVAKDAIAAPAATGSGSGHKVEDSGAATAAKTR